MPLLLLETRIRNLDGPSIAARTAESHVMATATEAPASAASPLAVLQRLLRDLKPESLDDVAAVIISTDLSSKERVEGLAAEVGELVGADA